MVEIANTSLLKRIRVFQTFPRLFQLGKCRCSSLEFNPWERAPKLELRKKKLSSCVYFTSWSCRDGQKNCTNKRATYAKFVA